MKEQEPRHPAYIQCMHIIQMGQVSVLLKRI